MVTNRGTCTIYIYIGLCISSKFFHLSVHLPLFQCPLSQKVSHFQTSEIYCWFKSVFSVFVFRNISESLPKPMVLFRLVSLSAKGKMNPFFPSSPPATSPALGAWENTDRKTRVCVGGGGGSGGSGRRKSAFEKSTKSFWAFLFRGRRRKGV